MDAASQRAAASSLDSARPHIGGTRRGATPPTPRAATSTAATRATAFGLDIACATAPPPLLAGAPATAAPSARALALLVIDGDPAQLGWGRGAELVCDEREPDGAVKFGIEADAERGYLIAGPRYGAHLLTTDGARLRCCPRRRADPGWQRLLIAQVLPFAALLQGLEVLHASAIAKDGAAVAFLGPSGAGKTSIALELCDRGAGFLADDVLALEARDGDLLAHPSTPFAAAGTAEAERMRAARGLPPEHVLALEDPSERLVRMTSLAGPSPLRALFILERRGAQAPVRPRFEPAADARLLLGSTFNFVLADPARLRGLLDVCALAARLRVERIVCDCATGVAQLAAAIEERLAVAR